MTNEEAVKMLRTMQRTVYLGNRKFEDAIECAIKALSEPLQPWEVLAAQAVLPQPKMGKWIYHIDDLFPAESTMECDQCHAEQPLTCDDEFCPHCGAKMEGTT